MRLLIVEDSTRLRESLSYGLRNLGHAVDTAEDGEVGLRYAKSNPYDVIVLDWMLPKIDGLTVLVTLRKSKNKVPILLLTALDAIEERVKGLGRGADDYLVKPFAFEELVARLEALERRRHGQADSDCVFADLKLDRSSRRAQSMGVDLNLTPREFFLLEFLVISAGKTVSREQIEDRLYDENTFPMSNAVDKLLCVLRRKLQDAGAQTRIKTRRGIGYELEGGEI